MHINKQTTENHALECLIMKNLLLIFIVSLENKLKTEIKREKIGH
jgi:hypothetical protein